MNYQAIKTLKARVEHCLSVYPETRNSDITLMLKVWELWYSDSILDGAIPLKALYELPTQEAVKRLRAKFNAEGRFVATSWEVAQARGMNESEWRVALNMPTVESTHTPEPSYIPPSEENKTFDVYSQTERGIKYRLIVNDSGVICTCPSYTFRGKCKHVQEKLAELRLLTPSMI